MPNIPKAVSTKRTFKSPLTMPVKNGIKDGSVPPFFRVVLNTLPMMPITHPPMIHTRIAPINFGP